MTLEALEMVWKFAIFQGYLGEPLILGNVQEAGKLVEPGPGAITNIPRRRKGSCPKTARLGVL